jgi:dihydroorotase
VFNVDHPVRDLQTTMSKLWHLGIALADVIAMTTINTARSIRRAHELGTLDVGRVAEISILHIDEQPAELSDGYETVIAERTLRAVGCVRAGEWIPVPVPAGVGA